MPLDKVTVILRDLDFNEVDRSVTGPNGHAILNAPVVENPQSFFVEAIREGAANFVPAEDARALDAYDCSTGFFPINFVSVSVLPDPPSPQDQKFEIDEGLGWATAISFTELIQKAGKKGFTAHEAWWARRTDIDKHLAEKNGQDVYIFFGHGGDTDGDTSTAEGLIGWSKFMWLRGGRFKSIDAMVRSVKSNGNPPGIVFLGACSSHSLLQPLVDANVKLAIGFTNCLTLGAVAGALKQFWEALLDGKTLGQALDSANKYVNDVGPLFNPNSAAMVFRGKAWVTRDMTLEEIRKHER